MKPFQVVRDFEAALCEYTGAPYAVTTTSCTMALLLAVAWSLRADAYRGCQTLEDRPAIEIPKHTYIGVPYAIIEAGGRPTFRDEAWVGAYQLKPLPVWDSARWFTEGLYCGTHRYVTTDRDNPNTQHQISLKRDCAGQMVCVSFHWSKTLGIQQGGAILHDNPEADAWLRRARFDGRAEGVAPADDDFPLERAWHAYLSPETAAAGLVRLASLPKYNEPLPNDDYQDLSLLKVFQ